MDPGLEKAKMLIAQAKRPIVILRERILRLEEMKDVMMRSFIFSDAFYYYNIIKKLPRYIVLIMSWSYCNGFFQICHIFKLIIFVYNNNARGAVATAIRT